MSHPVNDELLERYYEEGLDMGLSEEEAEEYNPEAYQGSLYDYSVRKRTPMSKKRSPKGKRGYKMKRK